jgi:hypothetical protein
MDYISAQQRIFMKLYLLVWLILFSTFSVSAQEQRYKGTVASHDDIEMEISSRDQVHYTGRYHYKGAAAWHTLKGDVTEPATGKLVLKAFDPSGNHTGSFHLHRDDDHLQGTWQVAATDSPKEVILQLSDDEVMDLGNPDGPDGYYYTGDNEMKIRTIDHKTLDAAIWISNRTGCTGILLQGTLTASPKGWTGLLPDELESGDASVTIRFEGNNAHILIEPKFVPGAGCATSASPYVRSPKKDDSELD